MYTHFLYPLYTSSPYIITSMTRRHYYPYDNQQQQYTSSYSSKAPYSPKIIAQKRIFDQPQQQTMTPYDLSGGGGGGEDVEQMTLSQYARKYPQEFKKHNTLTNKKNKASHHHHHGKRRSSGSGIDPSTIDGYFDTKTGEYIKHNHHKKRIRKSRANPTRHEDHVNEEFLQKLNKSVCKNKRYVSCLDHRDKCRPSSRCRRVPGVTPYTYRQSAETKRIIDKKTGKVINVIIKGGKERKLRCANFRANKSNCQSKKCKWDEDVLECAPKLDNYRYYNGRIVSSPSIRIPSYKERHRSPSRHHHHSGDAANNTAAHVRHRHHHRHARSTAAAVPKAPRHHISSGGSDNSVKRRRVGRRRAADISNLDDYTVRKFVSSGDRDEDQRRLRKRAVRAAYMRRKRAAEASRK